MPSSYLRLAGLDKRFGDLHVLDRIDLEVGEGEILALLGPSGSGKTTLLRLLAGFESPDSGSIEIDGREVGVLPPAKRRCGMVFQHYALFPHLDVGENVAFGLAGEGWQGDDVAGRVAEVLALVDLAGFERRRISQLSGGQQQRVAVARALAPEPRVLLLDEPLSNLDPTLRERTRRQLKGSIRQVGITTVFVTHEQEEAFDLGGRVAVLHRGRLQQVGTPEELYARPATRFVATFIGRSAVLPATLRDGERAELEVASGEPGAAWAVRPGEDGLAKGAPVDLVVRPEGLTFTRPGEGALAGTVVDRRYAGPITYFTVELVTGPEVEVLAAGGVAAGAPAEPAEGDRVAVAPRPDGPPPWAWRREGR